MLMDGNFYDSDTNSCFIPLGSFANYFPDRTIFSTAVRSNSHGEHLLEFHELTRENWRSFFEQLKKAGYTAIHLYPRGINVDNAWEGLDRGGQLNEEFCNTLLDYINLAGSYGIRTQLALFTQPETSVYCSAKTQMLFGPRFRNREEFAAAPSFVRRFCAPVPETVRYEQFFLDPDVLACCERFLQQLLPRIAQNPNIFALELVHEMGWCGPYAERTDTFCWESESAVLEWGARMVEIIRKLAPGVPVCISSPGSGILGHEVISWAQRIRPDFYSLHLYPQVCGHLGGKADYASIAEFSLKYAQAGGCAMIGEWECSENREQLSEWDLQLCTRDMIWISLIAGAPGTITRLSRSYGEYNSVAQVLQRLQGRTLKRKKPALGLDIRPLHARMLLLAQQGAPECAFGRTEWCPDRKEPDRRHRFCQQSTDPLFLQMINQVIALQEEGMDYDLTLCPQEYKANRPDQVRGGIRLEVPKGYRMRQMTTADGKTVITYLRNFERKPVWARLGQEIYAVRERAPKLFAVRACAGWQPFVFDLDLRRWLDDFSVFHGMVTSHDFIVILFREENEKNT